MDDFESLSLFPGDEGTDEHARGGPRRVVLVLALATLAAVVVWTGAGDPVRESAQSAAPAKPVASRPAYSRTVTTTEPLGDRPHTRYVAAAANKRSIERWIDENAVSLRRAYAQQAERNRRETERCTPITPSSRRG